MAIAASQGAVPGADGGVGEGGGEDCGGAVVPWGMPFTPSRD